MFSDEWREASELVVGDVLKTFDGKLVKITGIRDLFLDETVDVFNLEAGKFQNFVVEDGLIVHNSGGPKGYWTTDAAGNRAFITTETRDDPLGFKEGKFADYKNTVSKKIAEADAALGIDTPTRVGIQGSSATGVSSKTGEFVTKPGDLDLIMINDQLFDLTICRARALANRGELLKGRPIAEQLSYVENFANRGEALIHDTRLLPELPKQTFGRAEIEPRVKISQMVAKEGSCAAQKHTIFLTD